MAPDTATGFVGVIRSRHRYEAIVARNRELFSNARVLDLMGSDGLWSLAALDAGAAHVVRLEESPGETTTQTFEEYGFKAGSYQVASMALLELLRREHSTSFCARDFSRRSDPRAFFQELHRLQPKHVILDTEIVRGRGALARFKLVASEQPVPEVARRYATVIASPSHELIMLLCEFFGFQWRRIDWHSLGITNWTGIHDYERDERRTYVLNSIAEHESDAGSLDQPL